jgi:hypothetical protein
MDLSDILKDSNYKLSQFEQAEIQHKDVSFWMAEDFDAPLPDSFWLGKDETTAR